VRADPTVNNQVLDANWHCEVPFTKNPYAPRNSASRIPSPIVSLISTFTLGADHRWVAVVGSILYVILFAGLSILL
jgi:hypothetical protein